MTHSVGSHAGLSGLGGLAGGGGGWGSLVLGIGALAGGGLGSLRHGEGLQESLGERKGGRWRSDEVFTQSVLFFWGGGWAKTKFCCLCGRLIWALDVCLGLSPG